MHITDRDHTRQPASRFSFETARELQSPARSLNPLTRDKFKVPNAFWAALKALGLSPETVLRQSRLSPAIYDGQKNLVSTEQFFAIWIAIGELAADPAVAFKLVSGIKSEHYHPSTIAALHARTFRDALVRMARYKQLCCAEEMRTRETKSEYAIEFSWLFAPGPVPPLLIDAAFAAVVELGRRGTACAVVPLRIELNRAVDASRCYETFFQCPVKYGARKNLLVLKTADLDRAFVTHNEDLLETLTPQLERQLAGRKAESTLPSRVKITLKRLLSGGRPDLQSVAKELSTSRRTLQRRITDEGATFRQLLNEARRELMREYLSDPSIEINEAAFLLGFEDPNSFYRAFRDWEKTTPADWRRTLKTSSRRVPLRRRGATG